MRIEMLLQNFILPIAIYRHGFSLIWVVSQPFLCIVSYVALMVQLQTADNEQCGLVFLWWPSWLCHKAFSRNNKGVRHIMILLISMFIVINTLNSNFLIYVRWLKKPLLLQFKFYKNATNIWQNLPINMTYLFM